MAQISYFIPRTDELALIAVATLIRIQRVLAIHKLRTVDGLGYVPTVTYNRKHEGIHQRFSIWGIAHSPLQMERKISELIHSFKDLIKDLSENIFEAWKSNIDSRLYSSKENDWYHITKQEYLFNEVDNVQQLSDSLTRENIWTSLE
uniref:Uncharacterized protein n=1 Tax=Romanomermis culicivorax TaxID=13658 RepID=A0A915I4M9_ROMCU